MIAFTDKSGKEHAIENMSFTESKHGNITCTLVGVDDFGRQLEKAQGKGFSISEAFLKALDDLRF